MLRPTSNLVHVRFTIGLRWVHVGSRLVEHYSLSPVLVLAQQAGRALLTNERVVFVAPHVAEKSTPVHRAAVLACGDVRLSWGKLVVAGLCEGLTWKIIILSDGSGNFLNRNN